MKRALKVASGILIAAILGVGCSPMPIVAFRDREKERLAPVPPAIRVDRFLYDTPSGPFQLAFLVDDTELSQVTARTFEEELFKPVMTALYEEDRFRNLAQVTALSTNPAGRYIGWTKGPGQPSLGEIFSVVFEETPERKPWLTHDSYGRPRSTLNMLAAAPERPLVSTWVVATYNTQMQPPPAVALPADAIKGKHLLHFRILQRAADGPASGFPQCELLQRAAVERDRGLQGIKTIYQDLCDPDWPRNTREELLHSIEMEKKRMVLTEVPWEPQTIAVRGAFQRLQYGRDYIYESTENEIILVNPGSFRAGDLLEVSYYTGKPPEELPGNPQPGAP